VESVTASFKEKNFGGLNEQILCRCSTLKETNVSVIVVIEPSSSAIALGLVSRELDRL
jgi:hypothetical protein